MPDPIFLDDDYWFNASDGSRVNLRDWFDLISTGRLSELALRMMIETTYGVIVIVPTNSASDQINLDAAIMRAAAVETDILILPGIFKLTSRIVWDPTKFGIRCVQTNIDASSMGIDGPVITIASSTTTGYAFRQTLHPFEGFILSGPTANNTTVDGINTGSSTVTNPMTTMQHFKIVGFRDGLTVGSNTWLPYIKNFSISQCKRRGFVYNGTTNSGENIAMFNGAIHDCHNDAGTAVGIYVPLTTAIATINLFQVSLDYNDLQFDVYAGSLLFNGCHLEDANTGPMGRVSQTSGTVIVNFSSSILWMVSNSPDRSMLIECVTGSPKIGFSNGTRINNFNFTYDVIKGAGTPIVNFDSSCSLTQSKSDATAQTIVHTSRNKIYNGGFETGNTNGYTIDGGIGAVTVQTAIVDTGTYALEYIASGISPGTLKVFRQTFAFNPGESVIARGRFNIPAYTSGNMTLFLRALASDGTTIIAGDSITLTGATAGWRTIGRYYTPPQGTAFIQYRISCDGFNGTLYVDGNHLETV